MVNGLIVPYRDSILSRFRASKRSYISDVAERNPDDSGLLLEAYLHVFDSFVYYDKTDVINVVRGTALDSADIVDDVKSLMSSSSISMDNRGLLSDLLCLITPEVNMILKGNAAPQDHLYYANINLDEHNLKRYRDVRANRTLLYNPAFELSWFKNKDGVPFYPLRDGFAMLDLANMMDTPCIDYDLIEAYDTNIPSVLRLVLTSHHTSREMVFSYVSKALNSCDLSSISFVLSFLIHQVDELDSIDDVVTLFSFFLSLKPASLFRGLIEKQLKKDKEMLKRIVVALGLSDNSWDGVSDVFLVPIVFEAFEDMGSKDKFMDMSLRLSGLRGGPVDAC